MREALLIIERDALQRVNYKVRFRLWSYEKLSNLYGEPEDWMCDGKCRKTITGMDARRWLQENHRLWWKADDTHHEGLLFTADPRTGAEWDRARIADRTHRDGVYLREMSGCAERLQPSFRDHFRRIKRAADGLANTGERLKRLGDPETLRLLGVNGDGPKEAA